MLCPEFRGKNLQKGNRFQVRRWKISRVVVTGTDRRIFRKATISYRRKWELDGIWRQSSGRKFFGFFPVNSGHFQHFRREPIGNGWKKIRKFPFGTLLPSKSSEVPGTDRFLIGLFDLGWYHYLLILNVLASMMLQILQLMFGADCIFVFFLLLLLSWILL